MKRYFQAPISTGPAKLGSKKEEEVSVASADQFKKQFPKEGTFDAVPDTKTKAGVKFEFGTPDVRDGNV